MVAQVSHLESRGRPVTGETSLAGLFTRVVEIGDVLTDLSTRRLTALEHKLDTLHALLAGQRKDYYLVEEVAEKTGRSEYTVRRWITEGRITATRLAEGGPRGRLLIARAELDRLIATGRGGNVPESAIA